MTANRTVALVAASIGAIICGVAALFWLYDAWTLQGLLNDFGDGEFLRAAIRTATIYAIATATLAFVLLGVAWWLWEGGTQDRELLRREHALRLAAVGMKPVLASRPAAAGSPARTEPRTCRRCHDNETSAPDGLCWACFRREQRSGHMTEEASGP